MPDILVVEDERLVAADIQHSLRALGHTVPTTVATGEEALRSVAAHRPDLILMDIRLKGELDGIATARRIREGADVPIVFLTANADDDTIARARHAEPYGYVLKPFNERELHSTIEMALFKHGLDSKLRNREQWLSTTLRSIGDGVIAADANGCVSFMNPVAERLTGWKSEDAAGRSTDEIVRLVHEDTRESVENPLARALRERKAVELAPRTSLMPSGGVALAIDDSAAPILDDRGNVLGAILVFRDVSDRRRAQEQLMLADRLASLGTLTLGVAHEINNPLAIVMSNLEFARQDLEQLTARLTALAEGGDGQAQQALDLASSMAPGLADAQAGAERMRVIVSDLQGVSRPRDQTRAGLSLAEVVEAAVQIAGHQIRARAQLLCDVRGHPRVLGSHGQLLQVVLNLLVNAAQAIPEGAAAENEVRVALFEDGAGRAIVEVSDTGCGIAAADRNRVFDPFFTTKPVGTGTGLGLPISRGIALAHGGELTLESREARGATFRLGLPAI